MLLRTVYLSLDPYMRGRMSTAKSYAAPLEIGDVVIGGTVCEVVESRADSRQVGDVVLAFTGWQTHAVVDARHTRRLDPEAAPVWTALGVLGMPGFTAYAGLLEIGRPQPGETVVVAAAAGPVGSAVGQIARVKGARAVGIAGGAEKCRVLVEEFGFDAAVDHRSPPSSTTWPRPRPTASTSTSRTSAAPSPRRSPVGSTASPGSRSAGWSRGYNATSAPEGPDQLPAFMGKVLSLSLTVRGFIQDEFVPTHHEDFLRDMTAWVADGSVRHREDVVEGLEGARRPSAGCSSAATWASCWCAWATSRPCADRRLSCTRPGRW